jgi:hypothetical protein
LKSLVVEAVICEPVSIEFPAKQGKNREISCFSAALLVSGAHLRLKSKHLLPISLSFGAGKCMAPSREFFELSGKAASGLSVSVAFHAYILADDR